MARVLEVPDSLRIAFLNRPDAFSRPGGDTVVMVRLWEQLSRQGLTVDFYLNGSSLDKYDLLHLFNLTVPDIIEPLARSAVRYQKRFVVHAFQEDFPLYWTKSLAATDVFRKYVKEAQPKGFLDEELPLINEAKPADLKTSEFTLQHASAIFTSGITENEYMRNLQCAAPLKITEYGADIPGSSTDDNLFRQVYDVHDDFVLCVGRLETRKNQLMLLAALEHEDMHIVFADGGFTCQPEYASLCKRFKRRGPVTFTGRLSEQMLVSAFREAKVHCLPSWFELPGLVSLEAALCGCNVVASSWGSIRDYLGNSCWYCEPDDIESVRSAVVIALDAPKDRSASVVASRYTWERTANTVVREYMNVIRSAGNATKEVGKLYGGFSKEWGQPEQSVKRLDNPPKHKMDDYSLLDTQYTSTLYLVKECEKLLRKSDEVTEYTRHLEAELMRKDECLREATYYARQLEKDCRTKCEELSTAIECSERVQRELEATRLKIDKRKAAPVRSFISKYKNLARSNLMRIPIRRFPSRRPPPSS